MTRLTAVQYEMLKMLQSMPKLSREFVRMLQRDMSGERVKANLAGLVDAGFVDADQEDMHSITEEGRAWLDRPLSVAGPRQITNASTYGKKWTPPKMIPVRDDPSQLIRSKGYV